MNQNKGTENTEIHIALRKQIELYDRAIRIAEQSESESGLCESLPRIQDILDEISRVTLPAEFIRAHRTARGVGDSIAQLQTKVKRMLSLVDSAEEKFQTARDRLLPQLNEELTARRMLEAYGGQA